MASRVENRQRRTRAPWTAEADALLGYVQVSAASQGGTVPLFGKINRTGRDQAPPPPPPPADVSSHEFSLKLSYSAKCSEGVRLKAGPGLPNDFAACWPATSRANRSWSSRCRRHSRQASPYIARMPGSGQWLQYHHKRSPVDAPRSRRPRVGRRDRSGLRDVRVRPPRPAKPTPPATPSTTPSSAGWCPISTR